MITDLYTYNSICCSRITTRNYSTSFSFGIRLLNRELHDPVYAIYGFVRYADEIVDTFFDLPQATILEQFREETFAAVRNRFSTNPVLHSFQWVVNRFAIPHDLIEAFLYSMKLDLTIKVHSPDSFDQYVYGSAEVVGLMCLKVFCYGNDSLYNSLYQPARRLGQAFQKVNFLRDLQADFSQRGRIYFPGLNLLNFTEEKKRNIENDIAGDFSAALVGIRKLPLSSRLGVYTAYRYYLVLFRKISKLSSGSLLSARQRISDGYKLWLMITSWTMIVLRRV